MGHLVTHAGFMKLRRALRRRSHRLAKKHFSYRNPFVTWVAGQGARLRRLALRDTVIIGVTGSCGKTTTTALIGQVLSTKAKCQVKAGGNTYKAATRTMLALTGSDPFSIHEVGAFEPGSVARAARILRPHIGVVTVIGTDHYRQFRSLAAIAEEKSALVAVLPRSGTAILNADDPHVRAMASKTQARVVSYGLSADADVRGSEVSADWPNRLSFTVTYRCEQAHVQTQFVGDQWVTSVLAAIACGLSCGVPLDDCIKAVSLFEPIFARYSVHSLPGSPVYILDTRKAPAWTIPFSLTFIERAQAPRKTIVFGTLSDRPGGWTSVRYRDLARKALRVADRVVFVGPNAGFIDKVRDEAGEARLYSFLTAYQGFTFLSRESIADELILIKASISDHLERLMLGHFDRVVCWRQKCGKHANCHQCRRYDTPHAPPFGIAEMTALQQRSVIECAGAEP